MQHAVMRNLSPEFNPDMLLATGKVSYKQLKKRHNFKNIPISILGSSKFCNPRPVSFINDNQSGRLKESESAKICLENLVDLYLAVKSPLNFLVWLIKMTETEYPLSARLEGRSPK